MSPEIERHDDGRRDQWLCLKLGMAATGGLVLVGLIANGPPELGHGDDSVATGHLEATTTTIATPEHPMTTASEAEPAMVAVHPSAEASPLLSPYVGLYGAGYLLATVGGTYVIRRRQKHAKRHLDRLKKQVEDEPPESDGQKFLGMMEHKNLYKKLKYNVK